MINFISKRNFVNPLKLTDQAWSQLKSIPELINV
jgi:hypothetical protein